MTVQQFEFFGEGTVQVLCSEESTCMHSALMLGQHRFSRPLARFASLGLDFLFLVLSSLLFFRTELALVLIADPYTTLYRTQSDSRASRLGTLSADVCWVGVPSFASLVACHQLPILSLFLSLSFRTSLTLLLVADDTPNCAGRQVPIAASRNRRRNGQGGVGGCSRSDLVVAALLL